MGDWSRFPDLDHRASAATEKNSTASAGWC